MLPKRHTDTNLNIEKILTMMVAAKFRWDVQQKTIEADMKFESQDLKNLKNYKFTFLLSDLK